MNRKRHSHHPQPRLHSSSDSQLHGPYWRRAHGDWKFWGAVFFHLRGPCDLYFERRSIAGPSCANEADTMKVSRMLSVGFQAML